MVEKLEMKLGSQMLSQLRSSQISWIYYMKFPSLDSEDPFQVGGHVDNYLVPQIQCCAGLQTPYAGS